MSYGFFTSMLQEEKSVSLPSESQYDLYLRLCKQKKVTPEEREFFSRNTISIEIQRLYKFQAIPEWMKEAIEDRAKQLSFPMPNLTDKSKDEAQEVLNSLSKRLQPTKGQKERLAKSIRFGLITESDADKCHNEFLARKLLEETKEQYESMELSDKCTTAQLVKLYKEIQETTGEQPEVEKFIDEHKDYSMDAMSIMISEAIKKSQIAKEEIREDQRLFSEYELKYIERRTREDEEKRNLSELDIQMSDYSAIYRRINSEILGQDIDVDSIQIRKEDIEELAKFCVDSGYCSIKEILKLVDIDQLLN